MNEIKIKEKIKELLKKSCDVKEPINVEGMETIENLHNEMYQKLKGKKNGVYFVIAELELLDYIKDETDGKIEYKGKNSSYNKLELEENLKKIKTKAIEKNEDWVILYIGKAKRNNNKGLEERIKEYIKWGYREKSRPHSGGRAIWQVSNNKHFKFCWIEIENANYIEKSLHEKYKEQKEYGDLPFANKKTG